MTIEVKPHATIITGPDIEVYALRCAIRAMELWIMTGGRIQVSRNATPKCLAARFKLIDPKTGKAPKTAERVLAVLRAKQVEAPKGEAL